MFLNRINFIYILNLTNFKLHLFMSFYFLVKLIIILFLYCHLSIESSSIEGKIADLKHLKTIHFNHVFFLDLFYKKEKFYIIIFFSNNDFFLIQNIYII